MCDGLLKTLEKTRSQVLEREKQFVLDLTRKMDTFQQEMADKAQDAVFDALFHELGAEEARKVSEGVRVTVSGGEKNPKCKVCKDWKIVRALVTPATYEQRPCKECGND